jgi:hypothetical protein
MTSNVAWSVVLLAGVAVSGCGRDVTHIPSPPVSGSCGSNRDMEGIHFSFHKWKEGLAVMFVDRINGSVTESGSVDGITYIDRGSVRRTDGTGYEWRLKTKDGRSADLTINDVSYNLRKGALFAIQLDGDNVIVHQIDRDLSGLNIDLKQCTAFVNNSPDVIQLITGEDAK